MFLRGRIALTDLETTGLEKFKLLNPIVGDLVPWAEICEIGLVVADYKTLKIITTWNAKVKINYPHRIEPKAAMVNGYNENDWRHARELRDALKAYNGLTAGATFAAPKAMLGWGIFGNCFCKRRTNPRAGGADH